MNNKLKIEHEVFMKNKTPSLYCDGLNPYSGWFGGWFGVSA